MNTPNWNRLERDRQRHDEATFEKGERPESPGHIICNDEWTTKSQMRQMSGRFAHGPIFSQEFIENPEPRFVSIWTDRHGRRRQDIFQLDNAKQVYCSSSSFLEDTGYIADNWRDLVEVVYEPGDAGPAFVKYLSTLIKADPREPVNSYPVTANTWRFALCNLCCGFDSRARDVLRAYADQCYNNVLHSGWAADERREKILESIRAALETSIQKFSFA